MTTDIDIFRTRGVDVATDEKARRAVKAFRALQPTLTAYARNLTKRKDVVVEMAARDNGSTDGKKIYYRPPIALGEEYRHERRSCDKRDPATKELLCEACGVREEVLVTIYHEIGHIAFESFAEVSAADFLLTMEKAIEEVGTKYAKQIKAALDAAPYRVKTSYIGISNYVSPFLPFLVNCLEDARVNAEMFKARPGTKVMFDTSTTKIFREGVEQVDRTTGEVIVKKWSEYPLNAQVSVGVFCIASGYSYDEWFAPQVVEALHDEKLNQLIKSVDTIRSAAGIYQLSFPVLARLRELGFCKSDRDPENEEEQDESQDAGGSESGDTGDREPSDEDGSGNADSEADSQDEDSDASEGTGGSGDDREESGSEGDSDEGPSEGGSDDAEASSESGQPGAGGPEGEYDSGEPESTDDGGEGDAGPAAGDGADAGPAGSELDSDEEPVDESGAGEEAGSSEGGDELGSESGDSSDNSDEGDSLEGDDTDEAGAPAGGEEGTGAESPDSELEEGSGGGQAAESSREDYEGEDDGSDGEPGGSDLGSDSEQGTEPSDKGGSALDGNGDDTDESADPGSAGTAPTDDDADGDTTDVAPGNGSLSDAEEGDDEPFDSGADDGTGGIDLIEKEEFDDIPLGTPEEVEWALKKLGDHEEKPTSVEEQEAENAVDRAIIQGLYFETPSRYIYGVREHKYGQPVIVDGYNTSQAWDTSGSAYLAMGFRGHQLGRDGDFSPNESVLGAALVRMRVAFSDNKRGSNERNLKAGKVNTKVLGKRAWNNDERLFRKRTQPGKKDYFVVIGMDVSGSTVGRNIVLEKQAVMAQAELCKRMGIKFAIFAHSGNLHAPGHGRSAGMDLDVYFVKEANEPWDDKIKQRLIDLGPDSSNLDGHFLEYLRKAAEKVPATDKVILYYSDGKMPAENHDEELEILQREIRYCATRDITLLGVGIRTDSPARHGLETVQVDTDEDIVKVVRHLEKRLH